MSNPETYTDLAYGWFREWCEHARSDTENCRSKRDRAFTHVCEMVGKHFSRIDTSCIPQDRPFADPRVFIESIEGDKCLLMAFIRTVFETVLVKAGLQRARKNDPCDGIHYSSIAKQKKSVNVLYIKENLNLPQGAFLFNEYVYPVFAGSFERFIIDFGNEPAIQKLAQSPYAEKVRGYENMNKRGRESEDSIDLSTEQNLPLDHFDINEGLFDFFHEETWSLDNFFL